MPGPLSGRSLLSWQPEGLWDAGVTEVVVVTGFGAELVEGEITAIAPRGMRVRTLFNPFYAVADNLGSCWVARDEMQGEFLILNGDTLFEPAVASRLMSAPAAAITLAVDRKSAYDADDMKVRATGRQLLAIGRTLPARHGVGRDPSASCASRRSAGGCSSTWSRQPCVRSPGPALVAPVGDRRPRPNRRARSIVSIEGLEWGEMDFPADFLRNQALTEGWVSRALENALYVDPRLAAAAAPPAQVRRLVDVDRRSPERQLDHAADSSPAAPGAWPPRPGSAGPSASFTSARARAARPGAAASAIGLDGLPQGQHALGGGVRSRNRLQPGDRGVGEAQIGALGLRRGRPAPPPRPPRPPATSALAGTAARKADTHSGSNRAWSAVVISRARPAPSVPRRPTGWGSARRPACGWASAPAAPQAPAGPRSARAVRSRTAISSISGQRARASSTARHHGRAGHRQDRLVADPRRLRHRIVRPWRVLARTRAFTISRSSARRCGRSCSFLPPKDLVDAVHRGVVLEDPAEISMSR